MACGDRCGTTPVRLDGASATDVIEPQWVGPPPAELGAEAIWLSEPVAEEGGLSIGDFAQVGFTSGGVEQLQVSGIYSSGFGLLGGAVMDRSVMIRQVPATVDIAALVTTDGTSQTEAAVEGVATSYGVDTILSPEEFVDSRSDLLRGFQSVIQWMLLFTLLQALIGGWRHAWNDEDLDFLTVQLPGFRAVRDEPSESGWAELRESQLASLDLPRTGLAVTLDLGDEKDVHPRAKREVGERLALAALGVAYDQDLVYSGPVPLGSTREAGAIRVRFDHVGGGLVSLGGVALRGFAVAGEDRRFHWADATIEGDSIVVRSDAVGEPVAVRYAWADNPVANLANREGLLATPFRTDEW